MWIQYNAMHKFVRVLDNPRLLLQFRSFQSSKTLQVVDELIEIFALSVLLIPK